MAASALLRAETYAVNARTGLGPLLRSKLQLPACDGTPTHAFMIDSAIAVADLWQSAMNSLDEDLIRAGVSQGHCGGQWLDAVHLVVQGRPGDTEQPGDRGDAVVRLSKQLAGLSDLLGGQGPPDWQGRVI